MPADWPRDPVRELCTAAEECKERWGDDPAYKQLKFNLDKVLQELEFVDLSPGRRATLRAGMPNPTGQEPKDRAEAPSSAEKGY
jgi:hypothetical protein